MRAIAADRIIVDRSLRLNSVVRALGHASLAQRILLDPFLHPGLLACSFRETFRARAEFSVSSVSRHSPRVRVVVRAPSGNCPIGESLLPARRTPKNTTHESRLAYRARS